MIKKTATSLLVLCSSSLLCAGVASLKDAPSWLTNPPQEQICALGVSSDKSADAKAEAMLLSSMEHAMIQRDKIDSVLKISDLSNGKKVAIRTSKHSAYFYGSGLTEEGVWKDAEGRVYLLSCRDMDAKPYESSSFMILHKISTTQDKENNIQTERTFELYAGKEEIIKSTGTTENKHRTESSAEHPSWIDGLDSDAHSSSVGIASIIKGDIGAAYVEAMASARLEFAQAMGTQTSNDKGGVTKQVSAQTLEGTRMKAMWLDEPNQVLYVLVQKEKRMMEDKKLWKKLKDQEDTNK